MPFTPLDKKVQRVGKAISERRGINHEDTELYKHGKRTKEEIWSAKEDDSLDLDGKSILAIIISALIVFGPVFLVIAGLIYLSFLWLVG